MDSREGPIQILSQNGDGYPGKICNQLPEQGLTHPVSGDEMTKPFASSHQTGFVFRANGSSSGNMVFSDGYARAVCAIISGQTGRFRIYSWNKWEGEWRCVF